ncbi:hypothetical protein [Ruegeria marina]|uniref:Uncharacterized protein n=1 Tax=Ruegeria marina TaxID=639004 RepID=A0A1G6VJ38_9RHOB|nr:hypothetical protein [Ruegeria marina]SDD53660.1 hypothetical protein SAMN04488239_10876 [Ruegeria marina]
MRLGTVCCEGRERVVADLGDGRMLGPHLAVDHASVSVLNKGQRS